ncbi:MAG: carbamoyltransferase HypF [Propionibacteriaceae bacterium]|jgi:hydrogenase maturation protein HypF|nr:carbamoyltransferase HypF [Propionibacteriaceae bacterium]
MIRRRIELRGVVQGVGFRPHVARVATRFAVTGFCGNDDERVFIEVQGEPDEVAAFAAAVVAEAPPLARIIDSRAADLPPIAETGFRITASRRAPGAVTLISPDIATCGDCLREMNDPADRRYRYPFINCTNCGPRLSIIQDVPYDRPLTTMSAFAMCPACRAEYENPEDRRYHAQPISCWDCGPTIWLEAPPGADRQPADAHLAAARQLISQGKLVAVKGIGGFTLMCDARNPEAVARLRERKRRPAKPLAVMAGSLRAAQQIADVDAGLLTDPAAPIVLAPMAAGYDLAPQVAPGLDDVGVMLPYAPVHHLLLGPDDVWVATSANSSSLPLTYTNADARRDLAFADALLMNDRDIHVPVEDSVLLGEIPIRRSRGYAPLPVPLANPTSSGANPTSSGAEPNAIRTPQPVIPDLFRDLGRSPTPGGQAILAVGGELKNTFALVRDSMAFLSAHIGDMGSLETQAAFERSVAQLLTTHRRAPELVVVDKHPGYATSAWGRRYASRTGARLLEVQHHHAHALSLLAESAGTHVRTFLVVDGTGYGDDATIWGGELLCLGPDPLTYERVWHLPGFWLPGGDSAIRHPWKCALALLGEYGIDPVGLPPADAPADEVRLVRSQLAGGVGIVRTSSAGRLFDAVASLLGICHTVRYEAQAAMELETLARNCPHEPIRAQVGDAEPVAELTALLVAGVRAGTSTCCLARAFQRGFAQLCADAIARHTRAGHRVGITGGVACNRLLASDLAAILEDRGYSPLLHRIVPPNDGGLALGQALAGYLTLARGTEPT